LAKKRGLTPRFFIALKKAVILEVRASKDRLPALGAILRGSP
jgi:hypothetical protein